MMKQNTDSLIMDIITVILNFRTPEATLHCLHSLFEEVDSITSHVIVVDNASSDDSVEIIQQAITTNHWQSWVTLKPLEKNEGYAAGNNAAIKDILAKIEKPRYIHILNPDTFVLRGAIKALLNFMDNHPKAGIAGSRLENPDNTPQHSAFRFPTLMSEFDNAVRLGVMSHLLQRWRIFYDVQPEPLRVDWVSGASFLIRAKTLEEIGMLDQKYFLYYEEVDYCWKAHQAGWECWYVPQSRIIHLGGLSTEVVIADRPQKRRPAYWFNSRRRFFQKNYGWFYSATTDLFWMIGFIIWRIRRVIQQKPDNDPPHMLKDFFLHSSFLNFKP